MLTNHFNERVAHKEAIPSASALFANATCEYYCRVLSLCRRRIIFWTVGGRCGNFEICHICFLFFLFVCLFVCCLFWFVLLCFGHGNHTLINHLDFLSDVGWTSSVAVFVFTRPDSIISVTSSHNFVHCILNFAALHFSNFIHLPEPGIVLSLTSGLVVLFKLYISNF